MKSIRFGLAAVLLCAIAAIGAGVQSGIWQRQVVALTHGQEVITEQILELRNAMKALDDAETGQRGYLLTGQEAYLEPYDSGRQNLASALGKLDEALKADPATHKRIDELATLARAKEDELTRTVALRRSGDLPAAMEIVRTGEGKRLMDAFRERQTALLVDLRKNRNDLAAAETAKFDDISLLEAVILLLVILLASGAVAWLAASIRRLDELQLKREQEAMHDALTTLPNRRYLNDWMKMTLAAARRNKQRVVVLYFDLDGFKGVNDRLGHEAGDRVLQTTALRLRSAVRTSDFVARLGGDEFVAVLPDAPAEPVLSMLIARLAADLRRAPIPELADGDVSASIGLACHPEDGDGPDALLGVADHAMYVAKQSRRAGVEPALRAPVSAKQGAGD